MKRLIAISAVMALFGTGYVRAGTWTTIDAPGALLTTVRGIDGGNLAGFYSDSSYQYHGFIYSGGNWHTLDAPGASGPEGTRIYGIDGSNLVGYYQDNSGVYHGFLYDGTNWTTLDAPRAVDTYVNCISGNNLVGYSTGNSGYQNFLYDSSTKSWTDLPMQGWGIDGANVVGGNQIYNIATQTLTELDEPGAPYPYTYLRGIDSSNIVGSDILGENFLYSLTSGIWTTLILPGGVTLHTRDIYGNTIVGEYRDASGIMHGFAYEIPEPASALLLIVGVAMFGLHNRKH